MVKNTQFFISTILFLWNVHVENWGTTKKSMNGNRNMNAFLKKLLSYNWFVYWVAWGHLHVSHLVVIFLTKEGNNLGRREISLVVLSALKIFRFLSSQKYNYNAVNRYNINQEGHRFAGILIKSYIIPLRDLIVFKMLEKYFLH